jgi:transketolase
MIFTRQKLAAVARDGGFDAAKAARGGYVVNAPAGATFTVLATGSEVPLAQAALALLAARGMAGRLVSVPCLQCFEAQPRTWRDEVLPPGLPTAAVEAAVGLEWWKLIGRDGLVIGIDRFGASAPEKALAEAYGLTPAKVADRLASWLAERA